MEKKVPKSIPYFPPPKMEKNVDFRLLRKNSVTSSNSIFSSRLYNYCDPTSSYSKNYHIMAPSFSIRKFLGDWTPIRRKKIWNGLYRTTCLNRFINKSCNVRTSLNCCNKIYARTYFPSICSLYSIIYIQIMLIS